MKKINIHSGFLLLLLIGTYLPIFSGCSENEAGIKNTRSSHEAALQNLAEQPPPETADPITQVAEASTAPIIETEEQVDEVITPEEISTDDTYNIAEELNNIWGPAEHDITEEIEDYTLEDLMGSGNKSGLMVDEFSIPQDEGDTEWKTIYQNEREEADNPLKYPPDDFDPQQVKEVSSQEPSRKPSLQPETELQPEPKKAPEPARPQPESKTNTAKQIYQIVNRIKDEQSAVEQTELLVAELGKIPDSMENISFLMDLKPFLPTTLHDPINGKIADILEFERTTKPETF